MAALHGLTPPALGLGDEPVIDPVAEVQRWCDTLRTVDPALVPGWQNVRQALLRRAPKPMAPSVVHGDFRLGNLLAVGPSIMTAGSPGISFTRKKLTRTMPNSCGTTNMIRRAM